MTTPDHKAAARKEDWVPPADYLPGEYASYRLLGRLGAGGFGVVYRAACMKFPNVLLAVKFFVTDEGTELARDEARAGLMVAHPGIVRTFEFLDLRRYAAEGWPAMALVME